MNIKPVRTVKDHKAALAEVERLWDAKAGTPEHDRLDVLVTLIEAYEAKNQPIRRRIRWRRSSSGWIRWTWIEKPSRTWSVRRRACRRS
jgi:hypothetical protein